MPEYIEREALIKESTFMFDYALGHCKCVLVEDILNIPTADVVEVVRCKDCRIGKGNTPKMGAGWIYCNNNDQYHKETHFCSYGERRSENENQSNTNQK